MNRWLDSTSAQRVDVDVTGVTGVDEWMERLAAAGHFITSSSGTTGKSSFLHKSQADLDSSTAGMLSMLTKPASMRTTAGNDQPRSQHGGRRSSHAGRRVATDFARPDNIAPFPTPQATEGHHAFMARMTGFRRAMAEGTVTRRRARGIRSRVEPSAKTRRTVVWPTTPTGCSSGPGSDTSSAP